MRVARLYDFGDIRIEQSTRPRPGASDILVRTAACGICSGDVMPWYLRRKAPLVPGHEPVGVVEEVGAEVSDFRPGDRVYVHHHAPCFECPACRRGAYVHCRTWRETHLDPGGMAEFFRVSARNQRDTIKLPPSVRDADGVLIEPAACVIKSLKRSGLCPGDIVLVIGLGIMGMMHVRIARHLGAGLIIGADLFDQRAARARNFGADLGLVAKDNNLADQVRDATGGAMADVVIVGPGTPAAIHSGIACAAGGATVVQFTATEPQTELTIDSNALYFREINLVPSYSCGPEETRTALSLVERGVINARELVTHSFALERINDAFSAARLPEALKVVISFA